MDITKLYFEKIRNDKDPIKKTLKLSQSDKRRG